MRANDRLAAMGELSASIAENTGISTCIEHRVLHAHGSQERCTSLYSIALRDTA